MRAHLRICCSIGVAIVFLLAAVEMAAQSGRKMKKAPPQPPVQGVNQPEARTIPEPEAEPEKPKETGPGLIVASDIPEIGPPSFWLDIARQACAAELRNARMSDVRETRDKHRADASKIAKEDGVYVAHLELRVNPFGRPTTNARYEFDLRYTLYEPKTGKILHTGSGYPVQDRVRSPSPPIGYDYEQRMLELMGRDAGQKILRYLREHPAKNPIES